MQFDLFGFDFFYREKLFGINLCSIKNDECCHRSFFCLYYANGCLYLDILFFNILKGWS